jgi:hypothetical protein
MYVKLHCKVNGGSKGFGKKPEPQKPVSAYIPNISTKHYLCTKLLSISWLLHLKLIYTMQVWHVTLHFAQKDLNNGYILGKSVCYLKSEGIFFLCYTSTNQPDDDRTISPQLFFHPVPCSSKTSE